MIQLADARRIIAAAEKKADEIGQPMNIAVADAGGNLIASRPHGQRLARLHRHLHQKSLDLTRLRHRHQRPRRPTPSPATSSSASTPPTTARS